MTTTLDAKKRAVLNPFAAGDVIQIEPQSEDVLILRRMKPARDKQFQPRLVRRKNGDLVVVGGKPLTNDDVKRMLEDEECFWPTATCSLLKRGLRGETRNAESGLFHSALRTSRVAFVFSDSAFRVPRSAFLRILCCKSESPHLSDHRIKSRARAHAERAGWR